MLNPMLIGVPWEFPSNGVYNATHLSWGKDLGSLRVPYKQWFCGGPSKYSGVSGLTKPRMGPAPEIKKDLT